MDNPEKLTALGTHYTGRRQTKQKNKTQNTKAMNITNPTKKKG